MTARSDRRRRRTAVPGRVTTGSALACGASAAVAALLLGACGADAQSATDAPSAGASAQSSPGSSGDLLTVNKPAPEQSPPAELVADVTTPPPVLAAPTESALGLGPVDCAAAVRVHDNKHNICATWTNDAPNFYAPKSLFTGPVNFSADSIDANGDTAHHINKYPDPWFGASTWAATSAATGYGASMNWVFSSNEPGDTITGAATQDGSDKKNYSCSSVQQYVGCFVTRSDLTNVNGDVVHNVTYDLVNAPLTAEILNRTGQTMTLVGTPSLSNAAASAKGTSGTAAIAPSPEGGAAKSAVFGACRRTGGQAASLKAVYSFPDKALDGVTHRVTVDIEMIPTPATDFRNWTVDTSRSSCTDNPVGGSSPPMAQCRITGWTGNLTWFASAAVTVNVYNS